MRRVVFIAAVLIVSALAQELYNQQLLQKIDKKYGQYAKKRFELLIETMEGLRDKPEMQKLQKINAFFNESQYETDKKIYKQKDYWATPFEFLGNDKGDSEDFVFAKYFTLKELGVNPRKLFFTYVKSKKLKAAYMVLVYYKSKKSMPYILDSLNFKVLPANKRADLVPVYSFNAASIDKGGKSAGAAQQSLKFKTLLQAVKKERL